MATRVEGATTTTQDIRLMLLYSVSVLDAGEMLNKLACIWPCSGVSGGLRVIRKQASTNLFEATSPAGRAS